MMALRPGLSVFALCVGLAGCTATTAPTGGGADGARLEAVVDAVREALNEAQTNNVSGFPALKSVTIKLQTVASRSIGGQVQLLVFSLGTRYTSDAASTVELEMVPPKTSEKESVAAGPQLKEALAQAINLAKVGVLKASKGTPPLVMKNISIDVKFAVETQGSGGATVTLVPLGIEGSGRISRQKIQTVSLVFGH
jgi:NTP-dependent ternary system trypsin peptidase co-occuring protein